jgi:hypothetical protein
MLLPLLLAAALPAAAAPGSAGDPRGHELSVELGGLPTRDDTFLLFTDQPLTRSWGLRGAYGFGEHLSLLADLQVSRTGTAYDLAVYDGESITSGADALIASLQTTWIGVGPKARLPLGPKGRIAPYAALQGVALFGTARLDDDPNADDNPGQLTQRTASVGLRGVAGAEWTVFSVGGVAAVLHLEGGYLGALAGKVRDHGSAPDAEGKAPVLGDLQHRGGVVQAGLGVRF